MIEPYVKLLEELIVQGKGYNFANAVKRRTNNGYIAAMKEEWLVWENRSSSIVKRRFKPTSSPHALVIAAEKIELVGYGEPQFEQKQSKFVAALMAAKALLVDEALLESGVKAHDVAEKPIRIVEAKPVSGNIFIVHGHDDEMKSAVASVVERLGLKPVILHDMPDKGRTIIEKFHDYSDVGYAIVLLSPDDLGRQRGTSAGDDRPRARQNVILELGFFMGRLGRSRVLPLFRPHDAFEMPSDYAGVLYKPFDAGGAWKMQLCGELQAAGYDVDANRLVRG